MVFWFENAKNPRETQNPHGAAVAYFRRGRSRISEPLRDGARIFWLAATLIVVSAAVVAQQPKPITLRTAVEIALKANPDVLLARLDQEKAHQSVREARAPFSPQLTLGSGLAYTS